MQDSCINCHVPQIYLYFYSVCIFFLLQQRRSLSRARVKLQTYMTSGEVRFRGNFSKYLLVQLSCWLINTGTRVGTVFLASEHHSLQLMYGAIKQQQRRPHHSTMYHLVYFRLLRQVSNLVENIFVYTLMYTYLWIFFMVQSYIYALNRLSTNYFLWIINYVHFSNAQSPLNYGFGVVASSKADPTLVLFHCSASGRSYLVFSIVL